MRRPGPTRAQAQYQREQRALLRLRRAAVIMTNVVDAGEDVGSTMFDLEGAAFGYANALTSRERKRLAR